MDKDIKLAQDGAARKLASRLVDSGNIKVPIQKVQFYASYMQGMREAYLKLFPRIIASAKKNDRPYLEAEYRLLSSCIDACYDYQQGTYEIHYKDHVHDKKGNVVKCTAYFVKKKTLNIEVKYTKAAPTI